MWPDYYMPSSTLIYQLLSKNLANIQLLSLQLFGLLKNVVLDFNALCRFVFYKPMTPHLSIFSVLQTHESPPVHTLIYKPMTPLLSIFCVLQAHDSTPVHTFQRPRKNWNPWRRNSRRLQNKSRKKGDSIISYRLVW